MLVSNIYFHPYLGKWSNLTNIFQLGWNHQLVVVSKGFCLDVFDPKPPTKYMGNDPIWRSNIFFNFGGRKRNSHLTRRHPQNSNREGSSTQFRRGVSIDSNNKDSCHRRWGPIIHIYSPFFWKHAWLGQNSSPWRFCSNPRGCKYFNSLLFEASISQQVPWQDAIAKEKYCLPSIFIDHFTVCFGFCWIASFQCFQAFQWLCPSYFSTWAHLLSLHCSSQTLFEVLCKQQVCLHDN